MVLNNLLNKLVAEKIILSHSFGRYDMSDRKTTGSCFCGKVSYEISGNLGIFQYCHCSRCRKFTGSAFASNIFVMPDDFKWLDGEEYVGRYEPDDAKYFATCFCKNCGSSLPWLDKTGSTVIVPAGTLNDDPVIRPMQNIFCDSNALWYIEPNTLPQYEALPPKKK